jgi:two-component system response regulator NreC
VKEPVRIILVDDHAVVLEGLKLFLQHDKELQVVSAVAGGEEVLDLLANGLTADVILADIDMPGISGTELTRRIREMKNPAKIIMLTMHDDEKHVVEAFKAGANGYIYKNADVEEIIFALKRIGDAGYYICQALAKISINKLLNDDKPVSPANMADYSQRELEILALIANGYTNQEIADRLFTSRRTVEGHRLSLINKTGVRNTAALVKYAIEHGMIFLVLVLLKILFEAAPLEYNC